MKWIALLPLLGIALVRRGTNNVCKTFEDYYSDRDNNENCYYNPDHELEVPDIIKRHGYPVETHKVTTEDGYILTMFRIPHARNSSSKKPGKPVFIQHGITLNSGAFVNIGKKSLGFVLSDAGYDVWLGNFRGTKYSKNHTYLEETNSKFWDFSLHELGIYDLPAQLNLVYDITNQKIAYIGFSMGSTASYIYGVTYPEITHNKIEHFISLAPIAFLENVGLLKYLSHFWPLVHSPLHTITSGKLSPRPPLPSLLLQFFCLPFPFQMKICQIPDALAFGNDYEQNDPETLPVTMQHNNDAASLKIITHYIQLMHSGNFENFDYGLEENNIVYGSPVPPEYNLTEITVPFYLIWSHNDKLSTKEGVEKLYRYLPVKAKPYDVFVVENKKFGHVDFFQAKDVESLVYQPIVKFLDDHR